MNHAPIPHIRRGIPNQFYFHFGGLGALVVSVTSFLLGFFFLNFFGGQGFLFPRDFEWFHIWCALFSVGFVIMGLGCYGFYRNFNLVMGLAATIFIIIGSLLFVAAGFFEIDLIERQGLSNRDNINIGLGYGVATVTIGIALILLGVLFMKHEIFEPFTKRSTP